MSQKGQKIALKKRRDAHVVDQKIERNVPKVVRNQESVAIETEKIARENVIVIVVKTATTRVVRNAMMSDQRTIEKIVRKKRRKKKKGQR